MKNWLRKYMACIVLMTVSGGANAEWTEWNVKQVKEVQVADIGYFITQTTTGGWGASGCPGAQFIVIYKTEPNARELLALVLMAKLTPERKISAQGSCVSYDPNYFVTNNIVLH